MNYLKKFNKKINKIKCHAVYFDIFKENIILLLYIYKNLHRILKLYAFFYWLIKTSLYTSLYVHFVGTYCISLQKIFHFLNKIHGSGKNNTIHRCI